MASQFGAARRTLASFATRSSLRGCVQQQQSSRQWLFLGPQAATTRLFSSYPPHEVVGLPSLSPTMESGTIASWNLEEGESFAAGDVFCSVETDKATVDFEAQDDGVLAKILQPANADQEIQCGQPIMVTVEDADDVAAFKDFVADAAPPAAAAAAAPEAPSAPPAPAPVAAPTPAAAPAAVAPATPSGERVVASPLAHMLAKELGYDISQIAGTGPGGRIIAADVKEFTPSAVPAAAAASVAAPAAAPISGDGYVDYPLSDAGREIAARLTQSKQTVPHYYLTVDVSVDALLEMRSSINASRSNVDDSAVPIGVYEMLIKAAALSMKAVPAVNASWMDSVVRVFDHVDMNIVVGGGPDEALATPVIADAGRKGLQAISQELQSAVEGLSASEEDDDADAVPPTSSGLGTFTMLNLGIYGVKSCAPIIREPQACALALGALETRIVPNSTADIDDDDRSSIYQESVMFTATLSCDHRVVDGAVGAQWLQAFKRHVENPQTLLL